MKNEEVYFGEDLHDFIASLWNTDELRIAHKDKNSEVYNIIEKACSYPIFFYNPSDPLERSHFSTFYRFIPIRHYNNPAVNDLYYLHELSHLATMDYARKQESISSLDSWAGDMFQSEINASMISEVFVYIWFPTLRAKTFDFEIWVDRFLSHGITNTKACMTRLYNERIRAMNESNDDVIEQYIYKYAAQNIAWANIWKNNFYKVNKQINLFQYLYDASKSEKIRGATMDVLRYFIQDHTTNDVPFREEAQAFHDYLGGKVTTLFKV